MSILIITDKKGTVHQLRVPSDWPPEIGASGFLRLAETPKTKGLSPKPCVLKEINYVQGLITIAVAGKTQTVDWNRWRSLETDELPPTWQHPDHYRLKSLIERIRQAT